VVDCRSSLFIASLLALACISPLTDCFVKGGKSKHTTTIPGCRLLAFVSAVVATLITAQPLLIKGNEDSSESCEDWELSTPRRYSRTQLLLKDKLQLKATKIKSWQHQDSMRQQSQR
jgi:hypothetical protein